MPSIPCQQVQKWQQQAHQWLSKQRLTSWLLDTATALARKATGKLGCTKGQSTDSEEGKDSRLQIPWCSMATRTRQAPGAGSSKSNEKLFDSQHSSESEVLEQQPVHEGQAYRNQENKIPSAMACSIHVFRRGSGVMNSCWPFEDVNCLLPGSGSLWRAKGQSDGGRQRATTLSNTDEVSLLSELSIPLALIKKTEAFLEDHVRTSPHKPYRHSFLLRRNDVTALILPIVTRRLAAGNSEM